MTDDDTFMRWLAFGLILLAVAGTAVTWMCYPA